MEPEDLWLFGRIIDRLGDRETARDCWIGGLRADPNHPELLREIALDRIENGKPIQAADFARKLITRPGWQDRGNILLGKALAADDDPRGAVDGWSRVLASDPSIAAEEPGLRTATARAWLRLVDPARARGVLRPGGKAMDDAETLWLLGRSYLQERTTSEAEGFLSAGRPYRDAHPLEPEPRPTSDRHTAASATPRSRMQSAAAGMPGRLRGRPESRSIPARPSDCGPRRSGRPALDPPRGRRDSM